MAVEERKEMRYYVFIVYGLQGKWSIPEKEDIMARTAGIGIQNYSKIIERNCFYVDKTSFLKEWWESEDEVTLITRPRRFGKTLTMTEQFFSVKYAGRSVCGAFYLAGGEVSCPAGDISGNQSVVCECEGCELSGCA